MDDFFVGSSNAADYAVFFLSHGVARVDDRPIIGAIVFVIGNGL